ncbi:hypothetical protein EZV62_000447 [Acer yangbiense]|uniref:J domain-containing protein n=1 Tax=Acer yangbiense TaxID=1000413 RepID=A0A5C7IRW1_9ROSI|nr:hypothetical protein EZV62_000447 [Acer yangbiense]
MDPGSEIIDKYSGRRKLSKMMSESATNLKIVDTHAKRQASQGKSEFEKVHRNHYSFFEDLNEKDAEFCRDKAEELFKKEQFILAVSTIAVAFLKNPDPAEGATKFINEAWGIISDPEKRKTYDLAKGYRSVVQPATAGLQPCNPLEVDLRPTTD